MFLLHFIPTSLIYPIIGLCAIAFIVLYCFKSLVPEPYRAAALAILAILTFGGIYYKGQADLKAEYEVKQAEQDKKIAELQAQSAKVTTKVITKYVTRDSKIKENGNAIKDAAKNQITKQDDDTYRLPNKFVRLHDAAVQNTVPGTPGSTDDGPSDVKLSDATQTIVDNYGTCNRYIEQNRALKEWIREQQKVFNEGKTNGS